MTIKQLLQTILDSGLTKAEISRQTGIDKSTLTRIEKGSQTLLDYSKGVKLSALAVLSSK